MKDLPRTVKIIKKTVHNTDNVTIHLAASVRYSPGQFLMIWLPGVNEKPFSIAGHDADGPIITVRRRGGFSGRLVELKEGSLIGLRGPYGRPFTLIDNCCIVAGGIGLACLAPIADLYRDAPILYGEDRTSSRIYRERFPRASFYTTDGSAGKKGFPTDDLESVIRARGCDMVYCCGPEPMLVKAVKTCNSLGVGCQVSIERYMKCGTGICGQCACGPIRVCADGTVFDGDQLLENPDFGRRRLDASGAWQAV